MIVAFPNRRAFVGEVAVVTVLPFASARATPEALAAAIKEVTGNAVIREGRVTLYIPPLIENGNAVPLTVSVASPMIATDYVRAIHVFNEKNPQPHVFNAVEIFRMAMSPVIAANPFVSFFTIAAESGKIGFRWTGDGDFLAEESVAITVE